MPDISILIKVLEKYGAVKQESELLIPVYSYDPMEGDKYKFTNAIKEAGFYLAEHCRMDYIERLVGPKAVKTIDLRKGLSQQQGDKKVLDAVFMGHDIEYQDAAEHDRIVKMINPMMFKNMWNAFRETNVDTIQDYVQRGQAVVLANPHHPKQYTLMIEKQS